MNDQNFRCKLNIFLSFSFISIINSFRILSALVRVTRKVCNSALASDPTIINHPWTFRNISHKVYTVYLVQLPRDENTKYTQSSIFLCGKADPCSSWYMSNINFFSDDDATRISIMFTHRISVQGGSPLGASISCNSVQATKLPRQAHSTGQFVLSFMSTVAAFARPNDNDGSASKQTANRNAPAPSRPDCSARRRGLSVHRDIAVRAQSPHRVSLN